MKSIASESELQQLLQENQLACIKFTASWCPPCQAISPVVAKLQESHANIAFAEIDVDQQKVITQKHDVTSMPTFIFFDSSKEINRIVGAKVAELTAAVESLSSRSSGKASNGGESEAFDEMSKQALAFASKTKSDVLNDIIYYGEAEILNVETNDKSEDLRSIFDLSRPGKVVRSDTDSQLLIHLPLTNKSKIRSLYIKTSASSDESEEETQPPNKIRIWTNLPGMISFEDASNANFKPAHDGPIGPAVEHNGWREISLRYVLFQNVNSLQIFLDGEDEDKSTVVEKIVLIGNKGDSKEQGKLEKISME